MAPGRVYAGPARVGDGRCRSGRVGCRPEEFSCQDCIPVENPIALQAPVSRTVQETGGGGPRGAPGRPAPPLLSPSAGRRGMRHRPAALDPLGSGPTSKIRAGDPSLGHCDPDWLSRSDRPAGRDALSCALEGPPAVSAAFVASTTGGSPEWPATPFCAGSRRSGFPSWGNGGGLARPATPSLSCREGAAGRCWDGWAATPSISHQASRPTRSSSQARRSGTTPESKTREAFACRSPARR